jgi:hypothetical protein
VGFVCAAILVIVARGPWEDGWVGWRGGWSMRKKDKDSSDGKTKNTAMYAKEETDEETGVDANQKVLQEVAAEEGHENPLRDGSAEKSERSGQR